MSRVPVLLALSLDPVLLEAVTTGALLDLPGALAVRYEVHAGSGVLDRVVHDVHGPLESARVALEDGCVACTLRDDLLPALRRIACRRPGAVVIAPPATTEPGPVLRMLDRAPATLHPAAVVVAADALRLEADLLDDVLLTEAGIGLSAGDRRAVGEVLAHQLESADVVLLDTGPDDRASTLVRHLVTRGTTVRPLHATSLGPLVDIRRPGGHPRGDLRQAAPTGAPDAHGVSTVDLVSWRPIHPHRFLDALEVLGGGRLRGRGRFWLPTRPFLLAGWDGAGGQVHVGPLGPWSAADAPGHASTRIVVTGVDGATAPLGAAFEAALATDAELARGADAWQTATDGLEPWLGPMRVTA